MKENIQLAKNSLMQLWDLHRRQPLLEKRINVGLYKELSSGIPDRFLIIDEIFPIDEIDEIWENCRPDLKEYHVYPLMATLGGNYLICLGISDQNSGWVYYYDMDFGIFELDKSVHEFISKLLDSQQEPGHDS